MFNFKKQMDCFELNFPVWGILGYFKATRRGNKTVLFESKKTKTRNLDLYGRLMKIDRTAYGLMPKKVF